MRYKMKLKKVILALCSVATLSMIGCNNGSDGTGGNENEGNENIIKVKMNNDTVMDKGSVSQLQTNSDGSITYNASAKYSGGGIYFILKKINLLLILRIMNQLKLNLITKQLKENGILVQKIHSGA